MITKLERVGNALGVVIDRSILMLLGIDESTPLKLTTDGECLTIVPLPPEIDPQAAETPKPFQVIEVPVLVEVPVPMERPEAAVEPVSADVPADAPAGEAEDDEAEDDEAEDDEADALSAEVAELSAELQELSAGVDEDAEHDEATGTPDFGDRPIPRHPDHDKASLRAQRLVDELVRLVWASLDAEAEVRAHHLGFFAEGREFAFVSAFDGEVPGIELSLYGAKRLYDDPRGLLTYGRFRNWSQLQIRGVTDLKRARGFLEQARGFRLG